MCFSNQLLMRFRNIYSILSLGIKHVCVFLKLVLVLDLPYAMFFRPVNYMLSYVFNRVSKLLKFYHADGIHNSKIPCLDSTWGLPMLGPGNINTSFNWVPSSCLENIFARDSYCRSSCSVFLVVRLDTL